MNTYMRGIEMKFCCADMMMYFREGAVKIDYGYDFLNDVAVYTPIIKFEDSVHNFNYCPFCGKRFEVEVE